MSNTKQVVVSDGDNIKDYFFKIAGELNITVDFDSVDHWRTAHIAKKVFTILEAFWHDPDFAFLDTPRRPKSWDAANDTAREIMNTLGRKAKP